MPHVKLFRKILPGRRGDFTGNGARALRAGQSGLPSHVHFYIHGPVMPLSQGCSNSFSEVMRRRQSRRSSRYPRSAAPRTGHEASWRLAAAGLSAGREYHGSRRGPSVRGAGMGTWFRTRRQGCLRRVFGYFLHRKYPDFRSSLEIFFQFAKMRKKRNVTRKKKAKGF